MALTEADLQKIVRLGQLQTYDGKIKKFIEDADIVVKNYIGSIPADVAETDVISYLKSLITASEYDDSALAGQVSDLETAVDLLNDAATKEGSVAHTVATEIAKIVAEAPEDFDTLKEVADWIANDTTGAAAMQNDIAGLKTAVGVKKAEGVEASGIYAEIDDINTAISAITGGEGGSLGALAYKTTIADADVADDAAIAQSKIAGLTDSFAAKQDVIPENTYDIYGTATGLVGTIPANVGTTATTTVIEYVDAKVGTVASTLVYASDADINALFTPASAPVEGE